MRYARSFFILLGLAIAVPAFAASTLTGNIKTLAGVASTSRVTFSYKLQNCTADPSIGGGSPSALDSTQYQISPDVNGSITVTLYRTDTEINCDGAFTSFYTFYVYAAGKIVWQKSAYLTAATADLATLPSINATPPSATADYALRNAYNHFTAPQDFSGTSMVGLPVAPAFIVENPDTTLDGVLAVYIAQSITLTRVRCPVLGLGSITIQLEIRSDPDVPGTSVLSSPIVCNNTKPSTTSFAQASVSAGNYLVVRTPSASGTPNWLRIYFEY